MEKNALLILYCYDTRPLSTANTNLVRFGLTAGAIYIDISHGQFGTFNNSELLKIPIKSSRIMAVVMSLMKILEYKAPYV